MSETQVAAPAAGTTAPATGAPIGGDLGVTANPPDKGGTQTAGLARAGDASSTPPAPAAPVAGETKPDGTAKADDGKSGQDGKQGAGESGSTKVVTEVYDLKLPDGSLLPAEQVAKVTDFAKKHSLTPDAAQAVLAELNTVVAEQKPAIEAGYLKQLQEHHKTVRVKEWQDQIATDKEMGGQNLPETNAAIERALKRFGSPALTQVLAESEYNFHPEVKRILSRVGKAIADDVLIQGGSPRGKPKSDAEVFYPPKAAAQT